MKQDRARGPARRAGALRRMLDAVAHDLDELLDGDAIARRAHFGRYYLDHEVKRALGEPPTALRRRILLERAAHTLATTEQRVSHVAAAAHYSSLEAFTRAFRRAFGLSPTEFRQRRIGDFHLPAPNGVHYHPAPAHSAPEPRRPMDVTDRMLEHNHWLGRRLLLAAAELDDPALDEAVLLNPASTAFGKPDPSIREMLDRLVLAKEMWVASMAGHDLAPSTGTSIDAMLKRLAAAAQELVGIVGEIRSRGAWDTAYLDTLQRPPATTTFGAAIAHLIAWDTIRRDIIAGAIRAHGVDVGTLDPIAWELGTDPDAEAPSDDIDGIRLPVPITRPPVEAA